MRHRRAVACMTYGQVGDVLMQLAVLDTAIHSEGYELGALIVLGRTRIPDTLACSYEVNVIHCSSLWEVFTATPQLLRLVTKRTCILPPHTFGSIPRRPYILARLLTALGGEVLIPSFDYSRPYIENLAIAVIGRPLTRQEIVWRFNDDHHVLERLGLPEQTYAVFHVFAANPMRTLPDKRWVKIMRKYLEHQGGVLLLTGSQSDREHAQRIAEMVGSSCLVMCGELSFNELASVIKRARVMVGVDTGVTHLACLVGARVVVVGNLTNPTWLPTYYAQATVLSEPQRCGCTGRKQGECTEETEEGLKFRCMLDISDERILSVLGS